MMIGPLIMGTTASAGAESFSGFATTPVPMYLNSVWWSFTREDRLTPPTVGIVSRLSTDLGATWSDENTTYHTSFTINTEVFGNGIVGGVQGAFANHKDLATTTAAWVFTDITTLAGGFLGGGVNSLSFDETNNVFILTKDFGRDIYTSTDLVTYTPKNGVTENDLTLNNELDQAFNIEYVGGQYVAYGIKTTGSPDVYGSASSSDLISWTQETPDAPQFFHLSFFNGKYVGVTFGGVDTVKGRILEVYTSTDFITWTQSTLPNAGPGSSLEKVVIEGNYFLISNSQAWTSVNGTAFTEIDLNFNFTTSGRSLIGKQALLSSAPADRAMFSTIDLEAYGGKVINWLSDISAEPALSYPVGQPAGNIVGFTGLGLFGEEGIADNGFSIANVPGAQTITGAQGFYLNNKDVRYFEYIIMDNGTFDVGIDVPAEAFFSGLSISDVRLTSAGNVETSSGSLPVAYTPAVGQVIGFTLNFITAQVEIRVDNVLLTTIPNLDTSVLWTQIVNAPSAKIFMNIGQEPFVYTQPGVLEWGNPFV